MWVRNGDYWGVINDMNERIYKVLPTKGVHFPFRNSMCTFITSNLFPSENSVFPI
jgi:hypothetical protein